MSKIAVLREFWEFTNLNRKYWLLPIAAVLLAVALVLVLVQDALLTPLF